MLYSRADIVSDSAAQLRSASLNSLKEETVETLQDVLKEVNRTRLHLNVVERVIQNELEQRETP